jgi:hypothetical protein
MNWTPELDARLIELHEKRLGNRFIASWLRLDPAQVRTRLAELGLLKGPATKSGAKPVAPGRAAPSPISMITVETAVSGAEALEETPDDEDAGALISRRGCPRGHLVPEEKIAALYRDAGGRY